MKPLTIIWDFDGTLLPSTPYDSEQSLLIHRIERSPPELPRFRRLLARAGIYADRQEWFRKAFKKLYIRLLMGAEAALLDQVAAQLAPRISERDRHALRQLKAAGHNMIVLSCGTADLSQRVLGLAQVASCFQLIEGNRFQIENGRIIGMFLRMPNPEDKLKFLKEQKINPDTAAAIGDGYTDVPTLDWAGVAVLMDRSGKKKERYGRKNYHFISAIPEVLSLIENKFA
ncbi:MAG: haloacid dehalogenase-like hydrolase [Desulfobacterales bacterium]|nr:MAG: haloacid dehalogenase-like hydrolase [Desulfobacterales bacterium]